MTEGGHSVVGGQGLVERATFSFDSCSSCHMSRLEIMGILGCLPKLEGLHEQSGTYLGDPKQKLGSTACQSYIHAHTGRGPFE